MATAVSQYVSHLGRHIGFFKKKSAKLQQIFLKFVEKHIFTASNRNTINYRVEQMKLEHVLSKCYSFLIQILICLIKLHTNFRIHSQYYNPLYRYIRLLNRHLFNR